MGASLDQREGMGLLDYRAMPSLRDVAHYGWLCIAAGYSISTPLGSFCQGNRYGTGPEQVAVRPVHHVQNHTCLVTLLQPARLAAVLSQPSSLRLHGARPSIRGKCPTRTEDSSHSLLRLSGILWEGIQETWAES